MTTLVPLLNCRRTAFGGVTKVTVIESLPGSCVSAVTRGPVPPRAWVKSALPGRLKRTVSSVPV